MKNKSNAKQKREADSKKRKELWSPKIATESKQADRDKQKTAAEKTSAEKTAAEKTAATKPAVQKQTITKAADLPQQTPEEETREFLEYLEKYTGPVKKDDLPQQARRKANTSTSVCTLNLEDGMPLVEDAVSRMNMGLQELRVSHAKAVKLIHGYGSTGRGGKICAGVRKELADMKRRKQIRDFIPGEDFGPMDEASRKLAEQMKSIPRDADYGRMNHGITIVVL